MKNLICLVLGITSSIAIAQANTSTKTKVKRDYQRPSGLGADGYLGIFVHSVSSEPELGKTEPTRAGLGYGVKFSGSIDSGSFGLGSGIGWYSNSLKANNPDDPEFAGFAENDVRRQKKVASSGAFIDFFPHFRPDDRMQIGPLGHIALSPYKLAIPGEAKKSQMISAGAMVAYEIPDESQSFRFGLAYLTDINLETRSIQSLILSFDYGIPLQERFTKVVERRRTERKKEVVEKVVEKPVEKKVLTKQIAMVFDQQSINFVTAKAELLPASRQKLDRLAKFLAANRLIWSKVIIEGHTDRRGGAEYNMKLSLDRAISVGQQLTRSGLDASLISWQGFGPSRPIDPLDNEVAWARNRRVEIKFDGVIDELALRTGVGQAMK